MDIRVDFPKEMIKLINLIMDNGFELYLVGGCVRDMIMGREPHDFDMCTNADPMELVTLFKNHRITVNPKGLVFGTVTAIIKGKEYEITSYREDLDYADGRHPEGVVFVKDIKTDLSRRDFTINAMAFNPITKEIVDPFGGQKDIEKGIIRTVRNPKDRLTEDALRILRGLRFAITFGFDIDKDTFQAMLDCRSLLNYVSKERVTDEFRKMFITGKPIKKWFLQGAPIIFTLIPELEPCFHFEQNNPYHKHDVYEHLLEVTDACETQKFEIKMAALLHDIGKPASYVTDELGSGHFYGHPKISFQISRQVFDLDFRLTNDEANRIGSLVLNHDVTIALTEKSVKRALNKFGTDFMEDYFILHKADVLDHIIPEGTNKDWTKVDELRELYDKVLNEKPCFRIRDLAINGNDVKNILHIKGGPLIGEILKYLLDGVIDQKFENTKLDLEKAVLQYMQVS